MLIVAICSLPSLQIPNVSDNNETPHMILKSFLILVPNLPTTIAAEKFTFQEVLKMIRSPFRPMQVDRICNSLSIALRLTALCVPQVSAVAIQKNVFAMTCVGDSYDLALPAGPDVAFNPNHVTMQQLCAAPDVGGGPPNP